MQDVTKDTSQYTDNKSFNPTFEMYEHIAYGDDGAGNVVALKADNATETTLAKLVGLNIGEFTKVTKSVTATEDIYSFELNTVPTKVVTVTFTDATKLEFLSAELADA